MPPKRARCKAGKPIFKNLVFAACGDFSSTQNLDLPRSKIKTYITHHDGRFEEEVTEDITHLICTMDEYLKKPANPIGKRLLSSLLEQELT